MTVLFGFGVACMAVVALTVGVVFVACCVGLISALWWIWVICCLFWVGLNCLIFVGCGFGGGLLCLMVTLFWFI